MNRVLIRVLPLLVFLGLSHLAFEVKACSCVGISSVYEEYRQAEAVFVGKIIGSRDAVVREFDSRGTREYSERVFQFAVIEAFKGVTTSQIDISAGIVGSSCYMGYGIGETYLVYAFGKNGKPLVTGFCSRTKGLESAAADLHYIRELLRGVPEPRVYGSVIRREVAWEANAVVQRATPLEGIKILIKGEEKRFEVVTDRHGLFRLDQIPDGTYKASPLVADDRYKIYWGMFEVFALGSSDLRSIMPRDPRKAITINFHFAWNTELHGRILDAEGTPITGANVGLLLHRNPSGPRFEQGLGRLHDGQFSFVGMTPPDRYLLSVSIKAPFDDKDKPTTFYYPNTAKLDHAEPIEIGTNQKLEGKDIKLPPGYVLREIRGILVWPNGKPASNSYAVLSRSQDSVGDYDTCDSAITDDRGQFSLKGFIGAEYWVHGTSRLSEKGQALKIKVEMTNEPLKLVIPFSKRNKQ